jgi:hypothetical protein
MAEISSETTAPLLCYRKNREKQLLSLIAVSASKDTVSNNAVINSSTTPMLNRIQQKIQQHELLTQLKIVNKQLGLLRANPTYNATNFPLEKRHKFNKCSDKRSAFIKWSTSLA